jgi:hypothetical protein
MADIFISYSKNSKVQTEQLANELRSKGFSVWYDTSLVPGDSFRDVIMSELGKARAVIVIWTADSVKSDWVRSEASRARARRILVPVRVDDVRSHDIPPPFDALHTEHLSNRTSIEAALAKLGVTPTLVTKSDSSAPPGLVDVAGRPREGLEAVRESLRLDPHNVLRHLRLAQIATAYYFMREYDAAIDVAKEAIRSYPDYVRVHYLLAVSLGQAGCFGEAKQALERAIAVATKAIGALARQRPALMRPEDYDHMREGLHKAGWEG